MCATETRLCVFAKVAPVSAVEGFIEVDDCLEVGKVVRIPRVRRSAIKLSVAELPGRTTSRLPWLKSGQFPMRARRLDRCCASMPR
jgi:hypothetical protein